jgi:hypothetical protein
MSREFKDFAILPWKPPWMAQPCIYRQDNELNFQHSIGEAHLTATAHNTGIMVAFQPIAELILGAACY